MNYIFHISNTDIRLDNRICKELQVIDEAFDFPVAVVGVPDDGKSSISRIGSVVYFAMHLVSRRLRFLPRPVRYVFELIEFTVKAIFHGARLQPSIVHCHDTFALPAGWFLKLLYKSKLIYDAHELESNKNGQNRLLSYATLMIEKFCWNKIDLIVSVSDSIIEWYVNTFGKISNILVLNSPDLNVENHDVTKYCEKYFHNVYGIDDGKLVFAYLGILGHGRGIEAILDAFTAPMLDAHLVFIGKGVLASKIDHYSRQYSNVHLHDPVPHEQVVSLVKHANFGLCFIENVSLSDYYCLPNKLFEYVFAGLSVLACDFPEIKNVVTRYSLGICCTPDESNIRSAVNSVIQNGVVKKANGDLHELSWSAQASRLKTAYSELLNN